MGTEDLSTTAAVTPALAPASAGAQKMSQATVDLVENSSDTLRNTETMQVDIPLDTSLAPEHRAVSDPQTWHVGPRSYARTRSC